MSARCVTCDGTGKIFAHKSWFITDGFYTLRCGICGGTGEHSYQPDPHYRRFQKNARAVVAMWRGMKPKSDADAAIGLSIMNGAKP